MTEQREKFFTNDDNNNNNKPDNFIQYDHVFDLFPGENVVLGKDVVLGYVGLNNNTRQARFRIQAPTEISILRLEVFARHMQIYDYTIDVFFGQKLKIGDNIELMCIPDKHGRKLVHIGLETPREVEVKKSLKNFTDQ